MLSTLNQRYTLKKTEILNHDEFQKLFRQGRRVRYKDYLGIYLENRSIPRLGIAISRKLAGAVRRNYEKRVIRETFRTSNSLLQKIDLIVFPIRLSDADFQKKQRQIRFLFQKIQDKSRIEKNWEE